MIQSSVDGRMHVFNHKWENPNTWYDEKYTVLSCTYQNSIFLATNKQRLKKVSFPYIGFQNCTHK